MIIINIDGFVSPEDIAKKYPSLYHLTNHGSWKNIRKNGLLSTTKILDLFEIEGEHRLSIEVKRRVSRIQLNHPIYGRVSINDNIPINESVLRKCLDDNLTTTEWFSLLNIRVFFWTNEKRLNDLLNARLNREYFHEVIVLDTLSLTKKYTKRIELCPINSGSTLRNCVRRGYKTFTPMLKYSFEEWRVLRGKKDQVIELTVLHSVPDIVEHTKTVLLVKNNINNVIKELYKK